MAATLDFFSTYVLNAIVDETLPRATFFRDRYFGSGAGDIINADKVLVEYRKAGRVMAPFVSQRIGDIPLDRRGYTIHEYEPARIAMSRLLTLDELHKRGFGEAIYANSTEAERAVRLIQDDIADIEAAMVAREEWMAAQTMINNACTMQTYVDAQTKGEKLFINFFDGPASEHTYTVSKKWTDKDADYRSDVKNMCRMLSSRMLPAQDLLLGTNVADFILSDARTAELLDRNSGIIVGTIREQLTQYDGVTFMGQLNFGGYMLNLFTVDERFTDEDGKEKPIFDPNAVMVTAPNCGAFKYGRVTQFDYGATMPTTYAAKRVPKLIVDSENDVRKIRLTTRPIAVPKNYCPYIYAKEVVGANP